MSGCLSHHLLLAPSGTSLVLAHLAHPSPLLLVPQDNKNEKDFGKACRQEVKNYEVNAAKDYRLNFRLKKACEDDVKAICKDTCSIHEGEVGGCCSRLCTGRGIWCYMQPTVSDAAALRRNVLDDETAVS
jgi:hypothetical protein